MHTAVYYSCVCACGFKPSRRLAENEGRFRSIAIQMPHVQTGAIIVNHRRFRKTAMTGYVFSKIILT